jgi:hypothetical protein
MRAIAALLVALGPACALAQDPAPVRDLGEREIQVTFVPAVAPAAGQVFSPGSPVVVELAGQAPSVCSVKLLEMPIPQDVHFTMKVVRPPKIDDKIFAKVPAPACP